METILQLDYSIFEWINQDLQNAFLDSVMPWWRAKSTWVPFYVILIVFSIVKFKAKGLYFILFLVLTMGISDTMSSRVVKYSVKRLRPCNNLEIKTTANVLVRCGSGYSFTSSHATNHFTLAVFLFLTFCRRYKFLKLPLIFWAGSIALGQVYVGVHFPFDVLAGSLLGTLIGIIMARIYQNWEKIRLPEFSKFSESPPIALK